MENLKIGDTVKFINWNDEKTVGVITDIQDNICHIQVNDRIGLYRIDANEIIEIIDKNKVFIPIEEPIEEKVNPFLGLYANGGMMSMVIENLPNELTVFVPIFDANDYPIDDSELENRVNEVKEFLYKRFGDFVVQNYSSSYIDFEGNLQMKKHIQISSYPSDEEFNVNKNALINQLSIWARDWKVDMTMLEYEDETFYVLPLEDMMKQGGELWIQDAVKSMNKKGTLNSFTKQAKREGLSAIDFAKKVLKNPKGYALKTRRRAQFVKNVNPDLF